MEEETVFFYVPEFHSVQLFASNIQVHSTSYSLGIKNASILQFKIPQTDSVKISWTNANGATKSKKWQAKSVFYFTEEAPLLEQATMFAKVSSYKDSYFAKILLNEQYNLKNEKNGKPFEELYLTKFFDTTLLASDYVRHLLLACKLYTFKTVVTQLDINSLCYKLCSNPVEEFIKKDSMWETNLYKYVIEPILKMYNTTGEWIPTLACSITWSVNCKKNHGTVPIDIIKSKFQEILKNYKEDAKSKIRVLLDNASDLTFVSLAYFEFEKIQELEHDLESKVKSALQKDFSCIRIFDLFNQFGENLKLARLFGERLLSLLTKDSFVRNSKRWVQFLKKYNKPKDFLDKILKFDLKQDKNCISICLDICEELFELSNSFKDGFFENLSTCQDDSLELTITCLKLFSKHKAQQLAKKTASKIVEMSTLNEVLHYAVQIRPLEDELCNAISNGIFSIAEEDLFRMIMATNSHPLQQAMFTYFATHYQSILNSELWILEEFTDVHIFSKIYKLSSSFKHELFDKMKDQANRLLQRIQDCKLNSKQLCVEPCATRYMNHFVQNHFEIALRMCISKLNTFTQNLNCYKQLVETLFTKCLEYQDLLSQIDTVFSKNICDLQVDSKYSLLMQLSSSVSGVINTKSFEILVLKVAQQKLDSFKEICTLLEGLIMEMLSKWKALFELEPTVQVMSQFEKHVSIIEIRQFGSFLQISDHCIELLVSSYSYYSKACDYVKFYSVLTNFASVLREFKVNLDLQNTLQNFKTLVEYMEISSSKMRNITEVVGSLQQIVNQFGSASDFETFFSCLSKELINFLIQCSESDLPKMIDAVDSFNSFFEASIIKDMIDVYRVLKPLIQKIKAKESVDIQVINSIRSDNTSNFIAKLSGVSSNIIGIQRIYSQLTNRTESTKEMICYLVTNAKFTICLCNTNTAVNIDISALYQDKKHTFQFLLELNSRGMLLMNSSEVDDKTKSTIADYVTIIDHLEIASQELLQLYEWGYDCTAFLTEKNFSCLKEISVFVDNLRKEYEEWSKELKRIYKEQYWMTFYSSQELSELLHVSESKLLAYISNNEQSIQIEQLPMAECSTIMKICNRVNSYAPLQFPKGIPLQNYSRDATIFETVACFNCSDQKAVFDALLSLHLVHENQIPHASQVLFCTANTTWPEVFAFLCRCFYYSTKFPSSKQTLFSIVNAQDLSFLIQSNLVHEIQQATFQNILFKLVLLCEGSKHSLPFVNKTYSDLALPNVQPFFTQLNLQYKFVTSKECGHSKTFYIQSQASDQKKIVKITIAGELSPYSLMKKLESVQVDATHNILHIDIHLVDNVRLLSYFLFSLLCFRQFKCNQKIFLVPTTIQIYVEVANSINEQLFKDIAFTHLTPIITTKFSMDELILDIQPNSKIYIVCNYLRLLKEGKLDKKIFRTLSNTDELIDMSCDECKQILNEYFFTKQTMNISGHRYQSFINCMYYLLSCFKDNVFFSISTMQFANLQSVRANLVKCLLQTALDFSCRSVQTLRDCQRKTTMDALQDRFSNMISWEKSNHSIVAFHKSKQCITAIARKDAISTEIKKLFESQQATLKEYTKMNSEEIEKELFTMLETSIQNRRATTQLNYCMTADNFLKMLLIYIRIQSNIPVVICGETGCGKTSLIRYLATAYGVELTVKNIHAAISHMDIVKAVQQANSQVLSNGNEHWLFLDEVNTCNCLGLVSEIVCNHSLEGMPLEPNLKILCAVNPYRLKKEVSDYASVNTVGLKKSNQTSSKLAYTVNPLPESMMEFLWDFGYISDVEEKNYIRQMLSKVTTATHLNLLTDLVSLSQQRIRKMEDVSSVSLRDIARFCTLKQFFEKTGKTEIIAATLALSQCYYVRLGSNESRSGYLLSINELLKPRCDFKSVLQEEQQSYLADFEIPSGVAKNTALIENVFSLIVCILNKIPVFLVGKPGSTKTLAVRLIANNFRGKDSSKSRFRQHPRIFLLNYQGSESSTSEGIMHVFDKATKLLGTSKEFKDSSGEREQLLPVVFMDEIGLAEISKHNPLKVLHALLENDSGQQVSAVGISNWRLDASKMNRALYIARNEPTHSDLKETAAEIFSSIIGGELNNLSTITENIASMYYRYQSVVLNRIRFPNFHGLRDYYFLTKYIAYKFKENPCCDKDMVIFEAIERNFSGLDINHFITDYEIRKKFSPSIQTRYQSMLKPSDELIRSNLQEKDARHLLVISSGDAGLWMLHKNLLKNYNNVVLLQGSQFEEDITLGHYSYQILSKIILCIENGKCIILNNLDTIYGALYDMLNQNYTTVQNKKNCRIALESNSNSLCSVHDDFRCIVMAQKSSITSLDPPFLNRFEKHELKYNVERTYVFNLEKWLSDIFSNVIIDVNSIFPSLSRSNIKSVLLLHKDSEDVLLSCKQHLLTCMSHYAMVAYKLSSVFEESLYEYYFSNKYESLKDVLTKKKHPIRQIVYTFSSINENFEQIVNEAKVLKVNTLKSEKHVLSELNSFEASNSKFLFLLFRSCDEETMHLSHIKFLIEEKSATSTIFNTKSVIILINVPFHVLDEPKEFSIPEDKNFCVSFLSTWQQCFIDSIHPTQQESNEHLKHLLTISSYSKYINDHSTLIPTILRSKLPNCFAAIQFESNVEEEEKRTYATRQMNTIMQSKTILNELENELSEFVRKSNLDWRKSLLFDKTAAIMSSTKVTSSIATELEKIVEKRMMEVIFACESVHCIQPNIDLFSQWWSDQFQKFIASPTSSHFRIRFYKGIQLPFFESVFSALNQLGERYQSIIGDNVEQIPALLKKIHGDIGHVREIPIEVLESENILYSIFSKKLEIEDEKIVTFLVELVKKLNKHTSLCHCLLMVYCFEDSVKQVLQLLPIFEAKGNIILENVSANHWLQLHELILHRVIHFIKPSSCNLELFGKSVSKWISMANVCLLNIGVFNDTYISKLRMWIDVANYCQKLSVEEDKDRIFEKLAGTLIHDSAKTCMNEFTEKMNAELALTKSEPLIRDKQLRLKSLVYSSLIDLSNENVTTILNEVSANEEILPFCNQLVSFTLDPLFTFSLPSTTNETLSASLHTIITTCHLNSPFATLICDTFFKFFIQTIELEQVVTNHSELCKHCMKIVLENQSHTLDFVYAFAYVKSLLYKYAEVLSTLSAQSELIENMNYILQKTDTRINSLRLYLLKCLKKNLNHIDTLENQIPTYPISIRPWISHVHPTTIPSTILKYNIFFTNPHFKQNHALFQQFCMQEGKNYEVYTNNLQLQHGLLDYFASNYVEDTINTDLKNFAEIVKQYVTKEVYTVLLGYCNQFYNSNYFTKLCKTNSKIQLAVLFKILNWYVCRSEDNHLSLLVNNKFSDSFIISIGNDHQSTFGILQQSEKLAMYQCTCGYKYVIADCTRPNSVTLCPTCKLQLGGLNHSLIQGQKINITNQKGYIITDATDISAEHSLRYLSKTAFRTLDIIIHGLLVACHAAKILDNSFLQDQRQNLENYLVNRFEASWNVLSSNILGQSPEYLSALLCETVHLYFEHPKLNKITKLENENSRIDYEKLICSEVIDKVFSKHSETVHSFQSKITAILEEFNQDKKSEFAFKMDESDTPSKKSMWMYNFAREVAVYKSESDLKQQLQASSQLEKEFSFLSNYFKQKEFLMHLDSLEPILNWTNFILDKCSGKLSRKNCQDDSVEQFLRNLPSESELGKKLFGNFCNAWKNISNYISHYKCKSLQIISEFSFATKLSMFVIDTKESAGDYMLSALEYLTTIQNNFISLVWNNNTDKSFLSLATPPSPIPIQRAKKQDLILLKHEDSCLQHVVHCMNPLKYGCGKQLNFDFEKIQIQLAREILLNKKYLIFDERQLRCMIYENQFISNHENLIDDFMNKIPQQNLTDSQVQQFKQQFEQVSDSKERLNVCTTIELIMFFATKLSTGSKVSEIIEDAQQFQYWNSSIITAHPLIHPLIQDIEMKHLLHVYELVEELIMEHMIPLVPQEFREKIGENQRVALTNLIASKQFDVKDLRTVTSRFMRRFIIGQPVMTKVNTESLNCYILENNPLWPSRKAPNEKILDDSFLVNHVFELFQFAENEIMRQKMQPQSANPKASNTRSKRNWD